VIREALLNEQQHGFRKGCFCMDCVLAIKQIIKKRWEFNQETHILFVDYVKASNKVLRNKLRNIMITKGYPQHLTDTIFNLYNGMLISRDNRTVISQI
jgi:hypothetical protein